MNEKRLPPNDPREWLNRAKSNLAQAKLRAPNIYFEDLCFNTQQSAEKALKALLIKLNVRFPYTHDITELLTLIENAGQKVPYEVKRAGILSNYAVENRYPGLMEPVTEEEYMEAISIAEAVIYWVVQHI